MTTATYKIVGHRLCPYVQRVVIAMHELEITYEREDIELDDKPDWLATVSPNRQVPVFRAANGAWLVESGVIARYLNRDAGGSLLSADPLEAAQQEAWIAHVDTMLSLVARMIYRDADETALSRSMGVFGDQLRILEAGVSPQPWLAGKTFGLLDITLATLFRYIPTLNAVASVGARIEETDAYKHWYGSARRRASVNAAVPVTYETELRRFIAAKPSYMGQVLAGRKGSRSATVLPA